MFSILIQGGVWIERENILKLIGLIYSSLGESVVGMVYSYPYLLFLQYHLICFYLNTVPNQTFAPAPWSKNYCMCWETNVSTSMVCQCVCKIFSNLEITAQNQTGSEPLCKCVRHWCAKSLPAACSFYITRGENEIMQ